MMVLRRDHIILHMGRQESIVRYFNSGNTIIWELQALDATVDDYILVSAILISLPTT